jgi:hypothetical protein
LFHTKITLASELIRLTRIGSVRKGTLTSTYHWFVEDTANDKDKISWLTSVHMINQQLVFKLKK